MDKETLELIKEKVEEVERSGHGEVIIKVKNGYVYRVLTIIDEYMKRR